MSIRTLVATLLLCGTAAASQAQTLEDRIKALAAPYEATVGVAAIDTMTGRSVAIRGEERFPMASVYKFPISLAFLRAASQKKFSLDDEVTIPPSEFTGGHSPIAARAGDQPVTLPYGTLVVHALRDSDNTASDVMLRKLGGAQAVNGYLRFLGVTGVDVSRSEKKIMADVRKNGAAAFWKDPRDSATPAGMLRLLRFFDEKAHGLDAASQQFVAELLRRTTTGASRIVAGTPNGTRVLHKSGTMSGVVNDIGIIATPDERHRIALVLFTKGWTKTGEDEREKLLADITREIFAEFTK